MAADSLIPGAADPLLVAVHGETDTWEELEPLVRRHCQPFGGFAWTPKRPGLDAVVVERLELRFHAAGDALLDEGAPPLQWSSRPFLHILILRCDDAKAYKDSVFERTRAWVAPLPLSRTPLMIHQYSHCNSSLNPTLKSSIAVLEQQCCLILATASLLPPTAPSVQGLAPKDEASLATTDCSAGILRRAMEKHTGLNAFLQVAARTDARQELLLVHVQRQAPRQVSPLPHCCLARGYRRCSRASRRFGRVSSPK